ncbi:MAG TPA: phospholipase D family protein [Candidatus Dormibacteraeota bacterium]|nr:phospholipase D family protein [Candidatus Dormibacteraeota bacterium]
MLAVAGLALVGCVSLPGRDYPRPESESTRLPADPTLVAPFTGALREHSGQSGFRILQTGVDGLLLRLELIEHAQRSLDLQYYIFRGDESGLLIGNALVRAAQRGVRVRILVDDGETLPGDEKLLGLAGQANIAVRVFNPWRYRGHSWVLRGTEYLLGHSRLDYRMHNKLFVVDGVIAVFGGRNIGDQYFQVDPESQYADDDVFTVGAAVTDLAAAFDRYWNSEPAIPAQALRHWVGGLLPEPEPPHGEHVEPEKAKSSGSNFEAKRQAGEPLSDILGGRTALVWASAEVTCDSPDKKDIKAGIRTGSLMYGPIANAIRQTQAEFIMITPYLVPTPQELQLLRERLEQHEQVRILTNSLEANAGLPAQAGYMHYRIPLLQAGAQLFEVRAHIENVRGSGQSRKISRFGNFGLHAKLMVFDRSSLFIGSMNFDQRSVRLNTEIGLLIQSPELAEQSAKRFEAMTQPESAYAVRLQDPADARRTELTWSSVQSGQPVTYHKEPARSAWQRFVAQVLTHFTPDSEL